MKSHSGAAIVLTIAALAGSCAAPTDPKTSTAAAVSDALTAASPATGRIRGMVKLRGQAPATRSEPTLKDNAVCGTAVPVTRLALGKDNGISRAFVYLDGIDAPQDYRPAAALTVEQKGCEYAPHAMTLSAGSELEIVNDDPILHNVHARQGGEDGLQTVFNIAQPVKGQRTKLDPHLKPGIVTLTCEAGHPWMTGYILVTNHPYVAVTDADGRFVIEGVKPGTYPIKMWHEGVTLKRVLSSVQQFEYEPPYESSEQVVVPAGGETELNFELELRGS